MNYYIIQNRQMPWGDYGNMLFEGLLTVVDKKYNPIDVHLIERSGPYIPEIYKANATNLVVREDLKEVLLENKISGIKRVLETKINKLVDIDWQLWDVNDHPKEYPKDGEPYNYISKGKHDDNLLSNINYQYFSLDIESQTGLIEFISEESDFVNFTHMRLKSEKVLFDITNIGRRLLASEKFKELIEAKTNDCLRFIPLNNA